MAKVEAKPVRSIVLDDGTVATDVYYYLVGRDGRARLSWDTFRGHSLEETIRMAEEKRAAIERSLGQYEATIHT